MTANSINSSLLTAYQVSNGKAPRRGPKAVYQLLDFSVANPLFLDLVVAQDMDRLEFVQTLYIDNSSTTSPVIVQCLMSQQKITCPPLAQGYFPILVPEAGPKFVFQTTGTPIIPVGFCSMAMPCTVWNTQNVFGAAGNQGSGTITTGNTAQNLFGGIIPTNGYEICNPDLNNDLWISDSGAAVINGAGSIRVVVNGGSYDTPPAYKPSGPVSIIAAAAGTKFTARYW